MSYYLRDRSDGQVEIVLLRTVQVGLFPDWSAAEEARAYLKDDEPELPENRPINYREAKADVAEAADLDLCEPAANEEERVRISHIRLNSVASVPAKPRAAPQLPALQPQKLSEERLQAAFVRVQQGDDMRSIARDCGISLFQLSSLWDRHKRVMQKFMASAGQQPCAHCQRPFTPSISHPDTCARCSK